VFIFCHPSPHTHKQSPGVFNRLYLVAKLIWLRGRYFSFSWIQTLLCPYGLFFFSPPAISCKKLDGGPADVAACLKFAGPMPQLTQSCQLPCQDDCQLTTWSKFSSCAADCVGVRTRKRILVGKCWISRSNDNFLMQSPQTGTHVTFNRTRFLYNARHLMQYSFRCIFVLWIIMNILHFAVGNIYFRG